MDGTVQRKKAAPDVKKWKPQTRAVRGGLKRSNFDETSEALFLTSGYAYNNAEEAEATFKGESTHFQYSRFGNPTVSMFQDRGVPCLPVNTPMDFLHDEQTRFRGFFQPTSHPVLGSYEQPSLPLLIDGLRVPADPPPPRSSPPQPGRRQRRSQDHHEAFGQGNAERSLHAAG